MLKKRKIMREDCREGEGKTNHLDGKIQEFLGGLINPYPSNDKYKLLNKI